MYQDPVVLSSLKDTNFNIIYRLNKIHDPFPPHEERIILEIQGPNGLRLQDVDPIVSKLVLEALEAREQNNG